jgi:hypothetical protein
MPYSFIIREEALSELIESFLWYEEQRDGLGKAFRAEYIISWQKFAMRRYIIRYHIKNTMKH